MVGDKAGEVGKGQNLCGLVGQVNKWADIKQFFKHRNGMIR